MFAEITEVGRVLKAHLILASQKRLRGAAPRARANRREDLEISSQVASSHFCDLAQALSMQRGYYLPPRFLVGSSRIIQAFYVAEISRCSVS